MNIPYPIPYYNGAQAETKSAVAVGKFKLRGFRIENPHTAAVYIQFFDKLTEDVTVGTTTPDWTLLVPAGGAAVSDETFGPRLFGKGIVIAITAGRTNATAPGAAGAAHLFYEPA